MSSWSSVEFSTLELCSQPFDTHFGTLALLRLYRRGGGIGDRWVRGEGQVTRSVQGLVVGATNKVPSFGT